MNLNEIVNQLKKCEYQTKDGLHELKMNRAFIELVKMAEGALSGSSSGSSGDDVVVSGGQQDGGGFLSGYLSVVQFLVVGHGMDSIAEEAMRESGFTYEQFIDAQKRTVFESGRMNEVIKNAFGEG